MIEHIATLNILRNCLVHRFGIVGEPDCNDGQRLVIRWRAFRLFVRTGDGAEQEVKLPHYIEAGGELLARFVEVEKRFALGERASLSEDELNDLWHTFHGFGLGTAQRVLEFARQLGFEVQAAVNKEPPQEAP